MFNCGKRLLTAMLSAAVILPALAVPTAVTAAENGADAGVTYEEAEDTSGSSEVGHYSTDDVAGNLLVPHTGKSSELEYSPAEEVVSEASDDCFISLSSSSELYDSLGFNSAQMKQEMRGMATTMKCFVAGTMILTAEGLVAIENIKAGDKVIAADTDTGVTASKVVLETYIRKTSHLVHLTVCGETIVSTYDHPYYVKDKGFVNACDLWIGAELVNNNGMVRLVEQLYREDLGESSVEVFNFKVEDYHTYFVGENGILVHNAGDTYEALRKVSPSQEIRDAVNPEGKKYDPVYGYEVDRLEADHIMPLKEITEQPGFDKLSFKDQVEVANTPENFMGLGKASNASKGAKPISEWQGHSKMGPIPKEAQKYLNQRDSIARQAIKDAIAERLKNAK